jgi:hypothetical protein
MGFRGILKLAAKSLDNWEFMSWLMDRFDPENMSIEVEEGKQISVTGHSVKYIFELLSKGGDPPPVTDDTGKKLLMSVIEHLLPDEPSPKDVKVNPARTAKMIEMYTNTGWPNLDEDLCIRIFFMVLNNNFLTRNTYCYIRPINALWCKDTKAIAGSNWCKIVHENTREAGHKWKLSRQLGITKPAIQGCSLFLMVMYNFFVILQVPNTHTQIWPFFLFQLHRSYTLTISRPSLLLTLFQHLDVLSTHRN